MNLEIHENLPKTLITRARTTGLSILFVVCQTLKDEKEEFIINFISTNHYHNLMEGKNYKTCNFYENNWISWQHLCSIFEEECYENYSIILT